MGIESSQKILLIGGCGYIGSFIYNKLLEFGYSVVVCDYLKRGNSLNIRVINLDYTQLDESFLEKFDSIIWFGGHSSVSQSIDDPNGALANNCLNLYRFANNIPKNIKFIYASSASLYSSQITPTPLANEKNITSIPSNNPYDISKFAFDYLADNFISNFYGLRMGTLCGYSPNLRQELVFNSMNLSAVKNGYLNLMNSDSSRTILFLDDLWIFIQKLLTTNQQPGFFNVGSYSMSMGELATIIANTHKAQVIYKGENNTYSFLLDTTKMKAICGSELSETPLSIRCIDFIDKCRKNNVLN